VIDHAPLTEPQLDDILGTALRWLYDVAQPDGAILQHHGVHVGATGNRKFSAAPSAWDGRAVLVVDVAHLEYRPGPYGYDIPANPLEPGELERLAARMAELGAPVIHSWNGHPATSGSLALERDAHPSLVAAVDRYRAGCPDHTGPLCSWDGCQWYPRGSALIVPPTVPAAAEGVFQDQAVRPEDDAEVTGE
jgi:hypothetical protein